MMRGSSKPSSGAGKAALFLGLVGLAGGVAAVASGGSASKKKPVRGPLNGPPKKRGCGCGR